MGYLLTVVCELRLARCSKSSLTVSTWPFCAAIMSGVVPSCRDGDRQVWDEQRARHGKAAVMYRTDSRNIKLTRAYI